MNDMQLEGTKVEVFAAGRPVAAFADEGELLRAAPARICEWDAMARRHAADAVRLALAAGALLGEVKARLPHGAFLAWLATNCASVSQRTAQKYMALAEAARRDCRALSDGAADGGADGGADGAGAPPAAAVDERSLAQLYLDYGIVRRPPKWGGARPNSGRPAKGAAEAVAEAARDPDLNWAEVSGYLKGIREFGLEADGFGALADDDLESAVVILSEAAGRARAVLSARRGGGAEGGL